MAKAFNDFIVRLVVAFLLVMLGVSTAQCAASPRAVGGTAYSLKGPTKAQLGHTAPLNANAASPVTAYVIPGQTTLLEYYTEYDPSPTCYEVSPGAWTVNTPPQHGAVSFRQVGGPLPNGDCASQNFTFAAIYYTLTDSSAVSDSFTATWATPDHLFSYQFTFSIGVFNVDLAKNNGNCGCVGGVAEGEPINGATGNLFEAQIELCRRPGHPFGVAALLQQSGRRSQFNFRRQLDQQLHQLRQRERFDRESDAPRRTRGDFHL